MTDIKDIPFDDAKQFLYDNDIEISSDKNKIYYEIRKLIRNGSYDVTTIPISIVEWILAYNLIVSKINILKYTVSEIALLSKSEINKLAKLLGMTGNNIENIINILYYAHKLITLSILPEELILEEIIINNIDTNFTNICKTNKNFQNLCEDDKFWRKLYDKYYSNIEYSKLPYFIFSNYYELFKYVFHLHELFKFVYCSNASKKCPEFNNINIVELMTLGTLYKADETVKIPSEIHKLIYLWQLILSHNQIKTIPPEIGDLKNLKELILDFNQIKMIPPEIGNLKLLTILKLGDNQIKIIPPEIGNLINLNWLDLRYNQIKIIPPEIGFLINLRTLYLSGNQIEEIPPEIDNLKNLVHLNLLDNKISEIPTTISREIARRISYKY